MVASPGIDLPVHLVERLDHPVTLPNAGRACVPDLSIEFEVAPGNGVHRPFLALHRRIPARSSQSPWRSYSARHVLNVWRDAQCFNDLSSARLGLGGSCVGKVSLVAKANTMSLGCTSGSQGVYASVVMHWPHTQLDGAIARPQPFRVVSCSVHLCVARI
jgi:hypothetical protein